MAGDDAQRVTPVLTFQGAAEAAMAFYVSLFDDAEMRQITRYGPGEAGAEGSVREARFSLAGQELRCTDSTAAHDFTFTPSLSLYVDCVSTEEIERLYAALAAGGEELLPLDDYGFGARFGWVSDRFGVSWQLNLPRPAPGP